MSKCDRNDDDDGGGAQLLYIFMHFKNPCAYNYKH